MFISITTGGERSSPLGLVVLDYLGGVTVFEMGLSLARYRDTTVSVAVPQIGQTLHELDWQKLYEPLSEKCRFILIQTVRSRTASYPNIIAARSRRSVL
jgi:hypothetical protein